MLNEGEEVKQHIPELSEVQEQSMKNEFELEMLNTTLSQLHAPFSLNN